MILEKVLEGWLDLVVDRDIKEILEFLIKNKDDSNFTGIPILDGISYIAIDQYGYISLVVKTNERASYSFSTNYISLKLSNYCKVVTSNKEFVGYCHILKCNTTEVELVKMFILLCLAMGKEMQVEKNSERMIIFFQSLVQLFKITPAPNLSKERQGLWGELFIIKQLSVSKSFTRFWHSETNRKFDFSCGKLRLEVKTTTTNERIHSFSHGQIYREDEIDIVVASLLLQEEDAGLSLQALIQDVKKDISDDHIQLLKFEKVIRKAGMTNINESGPIFDSGYAMNNISFYNSSNVPKFNQAEPKGVSNTKYKIDLSTAVTMSEDEKIEWFKRWI
jgi:hypothetical protein